jgi:hypothetical protein
MKPEAASEQTEPRCANIITRPVSWSAAHGDTQFSLQEHGKGPQNVRTRRGTGRPASAVALSLSAGDDFLLQPADRMRTFPEITAHFCIEDGFCYPDWRAIWEWMEANVPEGERDAAWTAAARAWVHRNRDALGANYQVHETKNFLILAEAPPRIMRDACKAFEASLESMMERLEGIISDEGQGKHVVMMFGMLRDYYRYLSHFFRDGEHPMSGGMCITSSGYVHFAFPTADYSCYRTALVHELTHACLVHLPIPLWLDEALAMRMEQAVCGTPTFDLDREVFDKHRAHWNEETIQEFWSGKSWSIPGDSFDLSYNLAQVLWRKIEVDLGATRAEVVEFVTHAHAEDAGNAACDAVFGMSLGDLAADFLGEGAWEPKLSGAKLS